MKTGKYLLVFMLLVSSGSYSQDINTYLIPYRQGDLWGYATPDKQIVIQPKYNEANWFSEGLASVRVGNKFGYVNTAGTMVIPAKYTIAKAFRKGYVPKADNAAGDTVIFAGASTKADGYEICINQKGVTLLKCPAINENTVEENKGPVQTISKQKTYSLPASEGYFDKVVDDYKAEGSDETFYVAIKNNLYGVINSKFEPIVPYEYNSIKVFKGGMGNWLEVMKNGMYGVLNAKGQATIPVDNSSLLIVEGNDGKACVILRRNEKTYVKDPMNNDIISAGYSDIMYDKGGGFILTSDNNLKGYYFMDNTMIQPKYSDIKTVFGGKYLLVKTSNGKMGYVNPKGEEYFTD